jgi:hypothetical protein
VAATAKIDVANYPANPNTDVKRFWDATGSK